MTVTISATSTKVLSRVVKLSYLQSVQVMTGGRTASEIAGEGGGSTGFSIGSSSPGSPGFLGTPFGRKNASSYSADSSDTGWVISRTWTETTFDMMRYGVGIRDIGALNYKYANTSEFVSVHAISPLPLSKISLRVVEQIPRVYPIGKRWIRYFITHNDGEEWHEINPLDFPETIGEDGNVVPKVLTFNADIGGPADEGNKYVDAGSPVKSVRLKAVFYQATEGIDEPNRYSPVLKEYRLLLYPAGGLRKGSST